MRSAGNGNDEKIGQLFEAVDINHENGLTNIVTVGASKKIRRSLMERFLFRSNRIVRASFSNYGQRVIDLDAPGVDIPSTMLDLDHPDRVSDYGTNNKGTSFSAPHVSGALALMHTRFPEATREQLIQRLLNTVDPMPPFPGRERETTRSGGQLNLARALQKDWSGPFGWF